MRLCYFLSVEILDTAEDAQRPRLKINLRWRISGAGSEGRGDEKCMLLSLGIFWWKSRAEIGG